MDESGEDTFATWPDTDRLYAADVVASPHPAVLEPAVLLHQCELRTQRRSGPGGQHRNKTSSGVFLEHPGSGHIGEATERRSQIDNREVALLRLRMRLAVFLRTRSPLRSGPADATGQAASDPAEQTIRDAYTGTPLRLSPGNSRLPAVLALVLNDLWVAGGQPSLIAPHWRVSTSGMVRLIKSHGPAWSMVNEFRKHHGRLPLR